MADAEDLKSSGDFSSCGFDSHPGHHFFNVCAGIEARLKKLRPIRFRIQLELWLILSL
jgi:hypothetical protein